MPLRPLRRDRRRPLGRGNNPKSSGGGSISLADWALPGSSLDMDFQNNLASQNQFPNGTATSRLTLTRTTIGSAQSQNGTWTLFSSGQFRQTDKGLLIEESRTNNLLQCRDMTNAAWVKGATVTVAQTQTGIDGTANSASLVTGGAVQATNTVLQTITLGSASDSYSVFLKRITGSGTVEISPDGATWTAVTLSASYQQFQVQQTLANPVCGIRIQTNGDQVAADFSQLETGAFATTPILTTVAAVTRNADVVTLTSNGPLSLAAGTWYAEYNEIVGPVSALGELVAMRVDANNDVKLERLASNKLDLAVTVASAGQAAVTGTNNVVANTVYRLAGAYATNDFRARMSTSLGANPADDSSGTVPTGAFTVGVGNSNSAAFIDGYIRRLSWFSVAQTNAQMVTWAQGAVGP